MRAGRQRIRMEPEAFWLPSSRDPRSSDRSTLTVGRGSLRGLRQFPIDSRFQKLLSSASNSALWPGSLVFL